MSAYSRVMAATILGLQCLLMQTAHGQDSNRTVPPGELRNGSIGILMALDMFEVPDTIGCKMLVIVTSAESFEKLLDSVDFTQGPVLADVTGRNMRLVLHGSPRAGGMIGRVERTGQRVYVLSKEAYNRKF